MRIDWAIPVRGVEALADGTSMAVGIKQEFIRPRRLPGPVAIVFIACVVVPPAEFEMPFDFTASVLGPDMTPVGGQLKIEMKVARDGRMPDGWESSLIANLKVQFPAQQAGTYSVELTVPGGSKSVPVFVMDPPPPMTLPPPAQPFPPR